MESEFISKNLLRTLGFEISTENTMMIADYEIKVENVLKHGLPYIIGIVIEQERDKATAEIVEEVLEYMHPEDRQDANF